MRCLHCESLFTYLTLWPSIRHRVGGRVVYVVGELTCAGKASEALHKRQRCIHVVKDEMIRRSNLSRKGAVAGNDQGNM